MQNISKRSLAKDKDLIARLVKRMKEDHSFDEVDESKAVALMLKIRERDPSLRKKYVSWIIRSYLKGGIQYAEDLSRVYHALSRFDATKRTLPQDKRDINKFTSLADLEDIVDPLEDVEPSNKDLRRQETAKARLESEVLLETENTLVLSPKTKEAAIFWGRQTRWCTAATQSQNMYRYYASMGPLYVIIVDGEKFQFQIESQQLNDARDRAVSKIPNERVQAAMEKAGLIQKLADKQPSYYVRLGLPQDEEICLRALRERGCRLTLADITVRTRGIEEEAIKKSASNIKHVENPSDDLLMFAVGVSTEAISYIKSPSKELQEEAVSRAPDALKYIKKDDQILEVCEMAVFASPSTIKYAQLQTEQMCQVAVGRNGKNLQFCQHRTYEVCHTAVFSNPAALEFADIQDEEMALHAVKADGLLLKHVKDQTKGIVAQAVHQNPKALEFVKEQTSELCKKALAANPDVWPHADYLDDSDKVLIASRSWKNLQHMRNPTQECFEAALEQNGMAIKWIPEPTEEQKYKAVEVTPFAISRVPSPSPELARMAVEKAPLALGLLDESLRTEELCRLAYESDQEAENYFPPNISAGHLEGPAFR